MICLLQHLRFQVENLDKLINHVIPHFAEYPLHTVKKEYTKQMRDYNRS
jgi:hypothetical protein